MFIFVRIILLMELFSEHVAALGASVMANRRALPHMFELSAVHQVLSFLACWAANTGAGGFVRAVRCLGKVQTAIAFSVSLLVVLFTNYLQAPLSALWQQAANVSCSRAQF